MSVQVSGPMLDGNHFRLDLHRKYLLFQRLCGSLMVCPGSIPLGRLAVTTDGSRVYNTPSVKRGSSINERKSWWEVVFSIQAAFHDAMTRR